ncbi:MAG: DNA polymerase III subunit chi [Burkholderiaceae bacterium]
MTRIDFHFGVDHRVRYSCRVIRKARAADKRAVVYTRHADRLAQFDQTLWTFSALDFVPHVYAGSPLAAATPVLLALDAESAPESDVLVTLDDDPPPSFEKLFVRYQRVIEVVSCDDQDRQCARARFKSYRERGFEPVAHEVKNGD